MFNKLMLAVLLCGLTVTIIGIDLDTIMEQHQESLSNLWHMRNKRSVNSRALDDDCFDWYYDTSNDCMQTYRGNTAKCTSTADDAKQSLSAQGADKRSDLEGRGNDGCAQLVDCEYENDLLAFYDCYTKASSNGTSVLYKISSDSNAEYNSLSVQYANIDADKSVCNKNGSEKYIKELADANSEFNNCLDGGGVPANPTTTIPTITDSTTTEEATTEEAKTTEEATTEEATTEETTTEDATTEEATTEEATTEEATTEEATTEEATTEEATTDSTTADPDSKISYKKFNSPPYFSEEDIGKLTPLKNMWKVIRRADY